MSDVNNPGASGAGQVAETAGGWLRRQRQACGWPVSEMACQLHEAGKAAGDSLPERAVLANMIRRWESGWGVSERYQMLVCQAFGVPADQYGTGACRPGRLPAVASSRRPAASMWIISFPGEAMNARDCQCEPAPGAGACLPDASDPVAAAREFLAGTVSAVHPGLPARRLLFYAERYRAHLATVLAAIEPVGETQPN